MRVTASPRRRACRGRAIGLAAVMGLVAVSSPVLAQTEGDYLYRVELLRAAPGEFDELMDVIGASFFVAGQAGDLPPFMLRHSQGDHWDFMLIHPMGDATEHFDPERVTRRDGVWDSPEGRRIRARREEATSFHEEWFAYGVPVIQLARRFDGMDFYHIEMFAGLPGKRAELVEQRRMENLYYEELDRQLNLIFTRAGGSNWDAMTIGFYPSLQDYAAAAVRYTGQEQDAAARAAGFDGVDAIGPYLRSLLAYHHDTLAVRAR